MSKGYGSFGLGNPRGRTALAHRVSWFLHHGEWPTEWVLHHCDTPLCVRPDHLFLGDLKANMDDMIRKGRQRGAPGSSNARYTHPETTARGSRHGVAKLTEKQVAEIRQRYGPPRGRPQKGMRRNTGISQKQLAAEYGVDQTIISDIVRREYWQHVP